MPGAKIQANNPANDPDLKPVKGYSHFKPNMSLYKTHRFGMYEPHFALEVVPGDKKISYRSGSDIDTQNLKAPLMTPVKMSKDTFFVPVRALLPHNADLLTTNPLTGEDIVPEKVNCVLQANKATGANLKQLIGQIGSLGYTFAGIVSGSTPFSTATNFFSHVIGAGLNVISALNPLLSYGSLADSLGYNFSALFVGPLMANGKRLTYDQMVDFIYNQIRTWVESFRVTIAWPRISSVGSLDFQSRQLKVVVSAESNQFNRMSSTDFITFRTLLELLEQGNCIIAVQELVLTSQNAPIGFNGTTLPSSGLAADPGWEWMITTNVLYDDSSAAPNHYVNLSRLVAYQLICASFYTDDAVDYIYTAALWHQNQLSLYRYAKQGSTTDLYYTLNGVTMEYDSVSGNLLNKALLQVRDYVQMFTGRADSNYSVSLNTTTSYANMFMYQYYLNIFGYQRSLRFRDYFVGSRKSPLAVGDTDVTVNNNVVDVVDVTKSIQMQRFLNQVNRIGRRIREYSSGIFGVAPRRELDEPIFLSSVTINIGAEETSNTAESQLTKAQTTTSKLRKSGSNFVFSSDFNEFGVVIGITHFDITRPYVDALDRTLLHVDRFDMFNPYLQHIGDQEVNPVELVPSQASQPFGYKLRYSEYKQRTDRITGGFVGSYLPGFAFPVDINDLVNPTATDVYSIVISPDFIRAHPHEFDKFFNILPYDSMAGYFHFIIRHDNEVDADRPMEAAPSIL